MMKAKALKIVKVCLSFALAFELLFTALFTYRGHLAEAYELTFLSSFLSGIFFAVCALCIIFDKRVPHILYLCATILLMIVLIVCIAFSGQFKMSGGFAFLHIVNPLLVTAYYFCLCDMSDTRVKYVPVVAAAPLLYLVFLLIFGSVTGNFIYFFMNYEKVGVQYSVLFIVGILVGIFAFGFALYYLNRFFRRLVSSRKAQ